MAENTNSIAVFYEDGYYHHRDLSDLTKFHRPGHRYVGIHLYRLEFDNPVPKLTVFNGREKVALLVRGAQSAEGQRIVFKEVDTPPSTQHISEWSLELGTTNTVDDTDIDGPPAATLSGSSVLLYTMPFNDPQYDAMNACMSGARLNSEAVPTEGMYYNKGNNSCLL